jgi:hypothetical protein
MGTTLCFGQVVGFMGVLLVSWHLSKYAAPSLKKKKKQAHCVAQAWENNTWMNDIQGA